MPPHATAESQPKQQEAKSHAALWCAGVRLFAMYIESIGNPLKFLAIARNLTREKPILMVKSGRSPEGAHAAASHTGALADEDSLVEALLLQSGAVRVADVQELLDAARALELMPLPSPTGRVAIVTNSGGPAIMATDALRGSGLRLAVLSEETQSALRALLPQAASASNPVDLLAAANAAGYAASLGAVMRDTEVDAVIAIYTNVRAAYAGPLTSAALGLGCCALVYLSWVLPQKRMGVLPQEAATHTSAQTLDPSPLLCTTASSQQVMQSSHGADCAAAIAAAARANPSKPLLAVSFGRGSRAADSFTGSFAGVPVYMYPEQAVRSLGAMRKAADLSSSDPGVHVEGIMDEELAAARVALRAAEPRPNGWLSMADSLAVLAAAGIPVARHEVVRPFSWPLPPHPDSAAELSITAQGVPSSAELKIPKPTTAAAGGGSCCNGDAAADGASNDLACLPALAAAAAERLGFPVVLKGDVPGLVHKSEAGAVRVGLASAAAVSAAAEEMLSRLAASGLRPESLIVMEHAPFSRPPPPGPTTAATAAVPPYAARQPGAGEGTETIIGGVQNPRFGPVVAFGLGGCGNGPDISER